MDIRTTTSHPTLTETVVQKLVVEQKTTESVAAPEVTAADTSKLRKNGAPKKREKRSVNFEEPVKAGLSQVIVSSSIVGPNNIPVRDRVPRRSPPSADKRVPFPGLLSCAVSRAEVNDGPHRSALEDSEEESEEESEDSEEEEEESSEEEEESSEEESEDGGHEEENKNVQESLEMAAEPSQSQGEISSEVKSDNLANGIEADEDESEEEDSEGDSEEETEDEEEDDETDVLDNAQNLQTTTRAVAGQSPQNKQNNSTRYKNWGALLACGSPVLMKGSSLGSKGSSAFSGGKEKLVSTNQAGKKSKGSGTTSADVIISPKKNVMSTE